MKPEFYKKKLKNGLTVLFEKRGLPVISVALAARFGSGFESGKEKGISHFVEHMLFKGTEKRSAKQIAEEIDSKGGEHNAFTAKTFTAAWLRLPSKYIDFSIEILSDLFNNSEFDEKEIEKERGAILEEIKMYHDSPMKHVFEELSKLMYEKPFGISTLGTSESVSRFSKRDLVKKYDENYFTKNFILVVVGDADFSHICKLGEKYFRKSKNQNQKEPPLPIKLNGKFKEKRKGLDQAHLSFGVHFPSIVEEGRYAAEVFNAIFAEGASSRIFQEIRQKRGLAYAVFGSLEQEKTYGEEIVYVGTVKEKIALVEKILLKEFKKMSKITQKEVNKTKERLANENVLNKEDSRNVLLCLLFEEIAGGAEKYYKYEDKINKVKLNEIKKLGKLKAYSTFSLVPE